MKYWKLKAEVERSEELPFQSTLHEENGRDRLRPTETHKNPTENPQELRHKSYNCHFFHSALPSFVLSGLASRAPKIGTKLGKTVPSADWNKSLWERTNPSQALKKHKSTQYVYVILCLCSSSLLKTKTICACIMYILYKNWINT